MTTMQRSQLTRMASKISCALHKKAPELFGGNASAPFDVVVMYLPKPYDISNPFGRPCYFGATIKATGMAICFESMDDIEIYEATGAIICAPVSAWSTEQISPTKYDAVVGEPA